MRRPNPPSIVTISIFTTITIVFWIFFGVYQILTSDSDPNVPSGILLPINPVFNQEALNLLQGGLYFTEAEVQELSISNIPLQTIVVDEEEPNGEADDDESEIENQEESPLLEEESNGNVEDQSEGALEDSEI